jgi:hypothetical protein
LLTASLGPARADPPGSSPTVPFTFTFDERGNGNISVAGAPFVPLSGSLMADPTNGGALALTYGGPVVPFPVPVVTGDVVVFESGPLSDAIRFTNASGDISGTTLADRMIYYSGFEDTPDGDLADTGFPKVKMLGSGNSTFADEKGTEGDNGFLYSTTSATGGAVNYGGRSDSVPEIDAGLMSGALAILACGVLILRRRRCN